MSGRRCFLSACCVVAFSCGLSAGADHAAATKVDGSPVKRLMVRLNARFGVQGSDMRALVQVEKNSINRLLRIVVDSENYYRSSDVPLDGEQSAVSHFFTLNNLPAGSYAFLAIVYDRSGERSRVEQSFLIISAFDRTEVERRH